MNDNQALELVNTIQGQIINNHRNTGTFQLSDEFLHNLAASISQTSIIKIADEKPNWETFRRILDIMKNYFVVKYDDDSISCHHNSDIEKIQSTIALLRKNIPEIPTSVGMFKNVTSSEPFFYDSKITYNNKCNVNEIGKEFFAFFPNRYEIHGPVKLMSELDVMKQVLFFRFSAAYNVPVAELAGRFDQFAQDIDLDKSYRNIFPTLVALLTTDENGPKKIQELLDSYAQVRNCVDMLRIYYPNGLPDTKKWNPVIEISDESSSNKRSSDGKNSASKRKKPNESVPIPSTIPKLTSNKIGIVSNGKRQVFVELSKKDVTHCTSNKLVQLFIIWYKALYNFEHPTPVCSAFDQQYLDAEKECILNEMPPTSAIEIVKSRMNRVGKVHLRAKIAFAAGIFVEDKSEKGPRTTFRRAICNPTLATFIYTVGSELYELFFKILDTGELPQIEELIGHTERPSGRQIPTENREKLFRCMTHGSDIKEPRKILETLQEMIWSEQSSDRE